MSDTAASTTATSTTATSATTLPPVEIKRSWGDEAEENPDEPYDPTPSTADVNTSTSDAITAVDHLSIKDPKDLDDPDDSNIQALAPQPLYNGEDSSAGSMPIDKQLSDVREKLASAVDRDDHREFRKLIRTPRFSEIRHELNIGTFNAYEAFMCLEVLDKDSLSVTEEVEYALRYDDKEEFLRWIKTPEFQEERDEFICEILFNMDAVFTGETEGYYDTLREHESVGWTLLHYAALKGSVRITEFLLSRGERVDVKTDLELLKLKQATPLDVAVGYLA